MFPRHNTPVCRKPAIRQTSNSGNGAGLQRLTAMTVVACFCGCLYSFSGGTGDCPLCGARASAADVWSAPGARERAGSRTARVGRAAEAEPGDGERAAPATMPGD
jgi:hypothetical protein